MGLRFDQPGQRRLNHGTAPRDGLESLVSGPFTSFELVGYLSDRVEAQGSVGVESGRHVGQLSFEEHPPPGEEVVELAELIDSIAGPPGPRRLG